ncbi:hypothetical protein BC332_31483 [Capsicum chinense]|nr:hypothetical protein BC332_31483 [Capsicum chinense]
MKLGQSCLCTPLLISQVTDLKDTFQVSWKINTALRVLNLSHNELQGRQFATFEKDSYTGNDGLRGFPVSEVTFASGEEATALLKWKVTFKNQNNSLLASWQPGSDACNDWYGVSCINGRVNTLSITNASVFGTLYAFPFSSLPFLEYLHLTMNNLSGTILPEIGNLTNLVCLELHINQISGTIPSQIGSLVKLQILRIFGNHLNGPIPGEIGYLSVLGNLKNLNNQVLRNNQLSGPIPSVLGNLKNINYVQLSSNQLSGPIPSVLGNLINLKGLVLSYNQLTGSISSSFGNLRNMQTLFLGNNNLIEEIPSCFCNLTSVKILHLFRNNLKGKIPQCLGNISSLPYVMISHNNLSGELPSSICNLTSLQILDLGTNNLMGAIPQCFGDMSGHLEVLDMQHNNLSGTLPTTFGVGCALESFNLHGNKLEGKIPRSLENCRRLEVVDLGDILLNDAFPMWLGTLPKLRFLSLRLNKLHGPIRTLGSGNMYLELRILDVSSNPFTGNLPTSLFQHLNAMRKIDPSKKAPSDHERYGYYQNFIAFVTKGMELEVVRILFLYTTIDLSNNKFEGHIPSIIGDLTAFRILNLSHNGLQGHIPPSFGRLSSVESLDLSGNHLVGEIPAQFASLTSLEILNLSYNHLEGCIPQGNQFHTFENNSYEGNDGLRGFPLSKGCGNDGHDSASEKTYAESALDEESNSEFLNDFWKAALMGNKLSGPIPEEIGYLWSLTDLRLASTNDGGINNNRGGLSWSMDREEQSICMALEEGEMLETIAMTVQSDVLYDDFVNLIISFCGLNCQPEELTISYIHNSFENQRVLPFKITDQVRLHAYLSDSTKPVLRVYMVEKTRENEKDEEE